MVGMASAKNVNLGCVTGAFRTQADPNVSVIFNSYGLRFMFPITEGEFGTCVAYTTDPPREYCVQNQIKTENGIIKTFKEDEFSMRSIKRIDVPSKWETRIEYQNRL